MIIVKKPFIYLKDMFDWKYKEYKHGISFLDPSTSMLFEKRNDMTCSTFVNKDTLKTTEEAEYKIFSLLKFFGECELVDKDEFYCNFSESYWSLKLVKLGLKVVRNAEIVLATKEDFPLIIRNEKYNFYLAPRLNINILERNYI